MPLHHLSMFFFQVNIHMVFEKRHLKNVMEKKNFVTGNRIICVNLKPCANESLTQMHFQQIGEIGGIGDHL